jgi:hypothetical protein
MDVILSKLLHGGFDTVPNLNYYKQSGALLPNLSLEIVTVPHFSWPTLC